MKYFHGAELIEIVDAGHWLHHDQFDLFISKLWQFLVNVDGEQEPFIDR